MKVGDAGFALVASPDVTAPQPKSGKFRQAHSAVVMPPAAHPEGVLFRRQVDGAEVVLGLDALRAAVIQQAVVMPVDRALAEELRRCRLAAALRARLVTLLEEAFAGTSLRCERAAAGLYPAFVFETLSAASGTASAPADPGLPCGALLEGGVSRSIVKRAATLFHDHWRHSMSPEQQAAAALQLARNVSAAASEAQTEMQRSGAAEVAQVEVDEAEEDRVTLRCGGHAHTLLRGHYERLRRLYCLPDEAAFAPRAFIMLHRYFGLGDPAAEGGWHGAIPVACFESLRETADVAVELFASPLNCTLAHFCSAFADVDAPFGSLGSFFSVMPVAGTFEANPPFDHTVAVQMGQRMAAALRASSSAPLTFAVIVPCADRGKELPSMQEAFAALRDGGFATAEVVLGAKEVAYVDGNQQCAADTFFTARLDTKILLLQNAAAAPTATAVVTGLCAAWRGATAAPADEQLAEKRLREE